MIERYTRPEMGEIWSDESRFSKWLEIEVLVCEARSKQGLIDKESLQVIKRKAAFDVERIKEIEEVTRHDVIAFLSAVAEHVGPESRHIHIGLTSSDLLDTCFAMQLVEASAILIRDVEQLAEVLKRRAFEHKDTVMIGRSHGIHAEPITFGLVLTNWYAEAQRNIKRLKAAREEIAVGKISGAVGTFANSEPEIESYVCEKLGLTPAPISTQIVQRDRHAQFFSTLAVCAAMMEKISLNLRHFQRTEVLEAEEFFHKGQKGSSAMPHKRNPILAENLCGLARIIRGNAMSAIENVALWHERDISHSSVERVIGPDSTILLDFGLNRLIRLLDKLIVYPENMKRNMEKSGGLIFSEAILLALVNKGLTREEGYALVQRNAMKSWEQGADFHREISMDADISKHLKQEEIDDAFDLDHHLRHVDTIFKRVYSEE